MNKAKRKAIIAGNWKMNKTATEAAALIGELVPAVKNAGCEVVICTPLAWNMLLWAIPSAASILPRQTRR